MREWLEKLWRRVRHFRDDRDIGDELRVHLEMLAEDHLASGVSPAEARRRARVQLGRPALVVERVRDQEFITALEGWYRDLLLGLRALRKSPVFCLTAILTLALGIGANTAVFTLLDAIVLRSLPVRDAHRLARIRVISATSRESAVFALPYPMFQLFRRQQRSFSEISAWLNYRVSMADRDGALRVHNANFVSGDAFAALGINPYLGRLLGPADDASDTPASGWPMVLGYGFWQDHFGGDGGIVGQPIKVSGAVATVVGIAPPEFRGLAAGSDCNLYLPIHAFRKVVFGRDDLDSPNTWTFCGALGRLRPGVSLDQASAEIAVHQKQLLELVPPQLQHLPFYEKATFRVESARTGFPSFFGRTYTQPLYLMQGLVAVVLLLCCVNVGGLMMSQVYARRHEFAVRTAIGAARWRLIRQYLTESLVLASAGAALGAAVAWSLNNSLLHFFRHPMIGEWMSVQPDRTVLAVTASCALLATVFFGLLPALRAGRADPGVLLKSRTAAAQRGTAGRAFVPIQVALSVVLVTLATLLSQSLARLRSEHTGFDAEHVTIQTAPFNLLLKNGDARLDLYQHMVDRIEQMPGVDAAAVTWQTPVTGIEPFGGFQALSAGEHPPEDPHMPYNDVGPGYFRTMKTPILAGREFARNERERNICIVNQAAAIFLFPRQRAIGGYVRGADTTCRVIGVAADAKFANLNEAPPRTIYFPLTKDTIPNGNLVFLIHSATKAEAIAAYRKALAENAPTVPLVIFVTLAEQMDAALGSQTLITMTSDFFGGVALLLSAIGLYGLLASSVTQRTGEIGVRIALGAQPRRVLWMIVADALRLVGAGVLLGGIGLAFAVRLVRDMLYGVSAFDPLTWTATAAVLAVVGLAAALLPAWRAASVDPARVLRAE
jgi:predicted permease